MYYVFLKMRPCIRKHCHCFYQYLVAKGAGARAIERARARQKACLVLSPWPTDELFKERKTSPEKPRS